jgi:hypothetical protein
MKILFLATYFPRPLNQTIGTWALEHAKALKRASKEAPLRVTSYGLRLGHDIDNTSASIPPRA